MIHRLSDSNAFELVRIATLRAAQLMRGCRARVPGTHKPIVIAQLEVLAGKVRAEARVNGVAGPAVTGREPPGILVRVNR